MMNTGTLLRPEMHKPNLSIGYKLEKFEYTQFLK